MFTSFYLDQFLLVYFILLSQYPHTWLFYTGCISEHAIAAKGCVSSFSSFFSYITEATNWSSLCCWHTGVLFYALFPLILCSHALHYAGSGRFCFLVPVFIYSFPCCMFWLGAEPIDGFCTIFPFYYRTKLAAYALSVRVHFLTELVNFPGARAISLSTNPDLFHAFFDIGFKWS